MGTAQKQKQIREILDALGWSYTQLAEVLYEELYCDEYEDVEEVPREEIRKRSASLKKQLQRPSTPEVRLEQYIKVISEHPDFIALGLDVVVLKYVQHQCLSEDVLVELTAISSSLDEQERTD